MSKKIFGIIVVIVIIVSSVTAYWYTQKKEEKGKAIMKIEVGDTVKVNYTGRFAEGNFFDNGTVFDTSIKSVANDDINYSKAYSFKSRDSYSPLEFEVGEGKMIKGFDEGVLNMTVGETKNITVPFEKGYGEPHKGLFINVSKNQSVPLFETITKEEYDNHYSENIIIGMPMTHYFWGWNISIFDINYYDDNTIKNITMWNNPDMNSTINVFGWETKIVEKISSYNPPEGRILLRHNPSENITIDKEKTEFLRVDNEALNYIISQINIGNKSISNIGIVYLIDKDTFTVDYNPEVVGKTLIFEVTIISISKG